MGDGRQESEPVEIIPFEPRYRDDFKRLNVEWLEKYFHVEAIDHDVLSHPEEQILERGGFVFLARYKTEIVGTCALIKAGRGRMELSKMAVTERYQGLRIGQTAGRGARPTTSVRTSTWCSRRRAVRTLAWRSVRLQPDSHRSA